MNITPEMLHSLEKRGQSAAEILNAALQSVDPELVTTHALRSLMDEIDFDKFRKIGLISIGKAAIPMAKAAFNVLGYRINSGKIVTKVLPPDSIIFPRNIPIFCGNHPIPGNESAHAGEEIIKYLVDFERQDAVIFLISGGASALVTHPVYAVELEDIVEVTRLLLECGADITEINVVRKHLDNCKGGQLVNTCDQATCISLILSDVPGNRLDLIASGPTVPDPSTFKDAMAVLEKYDLVDKVPERVLSFFTDAVNGIILETPKPGNPIFDGNRAEIIASLEQAMQAAKNKAIELGFTTEFYAPLLNGEARERGVKIAEFLRKQHDLRQRGDNPHCWIGGGETTVSIQGRGAGGRNQELALAAVEGLAGIEGVALVTFATDGEDGQSPAAGAIVTCSTLQNAQNAGLNPGDFLIRNDSNTFFTRIDSSIVTGSTGTNVNDLVLMFLD
jgi:glycerate 2-kinase